MQRRAVALKAFIVSGFWLTALAGAQSESQPWSVDRLSRAFLCGAPESTLALPEEVKVRLNQRMDQGPAALRAQLTLELAQFELSWLCQAQRQRDITLAVLVGILPHAELTYLGNDPALRRHINENRQWFFLQMRTAFHGECEPELSLRFLREANFQDSKAMESWLTAVTFEIEALRGHLLKSSRFVCEQVIQDLKKQ